MSDLVDRMWREVSRGRGDFRIRMWREVSRGRGDFRIRICLISTMGLFPV